jgi:hypothetical protein
MTAKKSNPPAKPVKSPLSADTTQPVERDRIAHAYMSRMAGALEEIAKLLQVVAKPPVMMPGTDNRDRDFIDGQWRRRAGDVYASVAEPGSPNAGDISPPDKTP